MTAYVYRDGRIVPKHLAAPHYAPRKAPAIITDAMPPTRHMGTGRWHESKSAFRRDTAAIGATEVGTDPAILRPQPKPEPAGVEADVRRAIEQLRSR